MCDSIYGAVCTSPLSFQKCATLCPSEIWSSQPYSQAQMKPDFEHTLVHIWALVWVYLATESSVRFTLSHFRQVKWLFPRYALTTFRCWDTGVGGHWSKGHLIGPLSRYQRRANQLNKLTPMLTRWLRNELLYVPFFFMLSHLWTLWAVVVLAACRRDRVWASFLHAGSLLWQ